MNVQDTVIVLPSGTKKYEMPHNPDVEVRDEDGIPYMVSRLEKDTTDPTVSGFYVIATYVPADSIHLIIDKVDGYLKERSTQWFECLAMNRPDKAEQIRKNAQAFIKRVFEE